MSIANARPAAEASSSKAIQRQIVSASLRLAALTLIVKIVSAGKDIVVARTFGAGDEMDAFLIALAIPTYLVSVVGGSLSGTLLPLYVQAREQNGPAAAKRLLGSTLCGAGVTLLLISTASALLGELILPAVGARFVPEKLLLVKRLYYVLLGTFLCGSVSMLLASALNSYRRFTLSGIAPALVPAAILGFLWLGNERFGTFALASGTITGYLLELGVLAWAVAHSGLLSLADLRLCKEELLMLSRRAAPLILSTAILGCSGIIDQAMASTLDAGSVSLLAYGNKIVSLIVTVLVASLTTTIYPSFSRMVALSQWTEIRSTLRVFLLLILLTTVPLTIAIAISNEWLVRTLFEGGRFTAATTKLVASVQLGYLLQIPFYTLGVVAVRLLMAMGGNPTVLKIACGSLTINVVGNFVLMRQFGAAGIALSTSLVYVVACMLILAAVYRRLAKMESAMPIPRPHFSLASSSPR